MSFADATETHAPNVRSSVVERMEGWLGALAPWLLLAVVAALVLGPVGALVYGALRSDSSKNIM